MRPTNLILGLLLIGAGLWIIRHRARFAANEGRHELGTLGWTLVGILFMIGGLLKIAHEAIIR